MKEKGLASKVLSKVLKVVKTGAIILVSFMLGFSIGSTEGDETTTTTGTVVSEAEGTKKDVSKEVYNKNGIVVTYTGFKRDSSEHEVCFKIENNSGKTVIIQTDATSINGIMVSDLMSATVADGKVANDSCYITDEEFNKNGIDKVENIETTLKIMNEEFDHLDKKTITIENVE